jgi:DHA1 family inner membrane transport protein
MSVVQSGYSAALVAGVLGGSALAEWKGWRWSFMAFGVLSLVVFTLILTLLPDDREAAHSHAAMEGHKGRFHNIRAAMRGRDRVAAITSAFFVSAGFTGFLLYIGTWLATTFNLPTTRVSMVFMVAGAASLIGGIAAGPVADRFGKQRLSLLSSVVLAATLIVIPRLGWGAALFGCFLVAALAFAFRQGPIQALATELVPRAIRGTLVAVRNTASQVGTAAATAACGLLFDEYGYGAVGAFSAAMTISAAVCIAFMREPQGDATTHAADA